MKRSRFSRVAIDPFLSFTTGRSWPLIQRAFQQLLRRRARLVIEGEMANDRMTLHVEVAASANGLRERIAETIRDVTKLRGEVTLCAPASLPNDAKIIDDARHYK